MPAANLVRLALRKLEGVMTRPPLQRHIALQVADAYLAGAYECSLAEATRIKPRPTPRNHTEWCQDQVAQMNETTDAWMVNRLVVALQAQVAQLHYGFDDEHNAQWASVYAAGLQ